MEQATFIDTHAHLDGERFNDDLDAVIQRAHAAGVHNIITVGCDIESSQASIKLSEGYPNIYAAVGIHPHEAEQATAAAMSHLEQLAQHERVVAIGEIGLDYYRNHGPYTQQHQALRKQIHLAQRCKLPIIIHDREAHADTLRIIKEENGGCNGGVFHCFSGDIAMAKQCVDLGFHLSFTGSITYPKNCDIRETINHIPLERILVETDCPYLAPQKWRGKRNVPAYVVNTAQQIAQIKQLSLDDIARITTQNAQRLFGIGTVDQANKIAYRIRNSLYLNITNRCTNSCIFCAKFRDFNVKGHHLKLDHEPDFAEVIAAIGDPTKYDEVVFCGYGEPLLRLQLVKQVAQWLKQHQAKVRINTDGQANLVHQRNIIPELKGLVDTISISLNAPDAEHYQQICRSTFGADGYASVRQFIKLAADTIPEVIASAVTVPGIDIAACASICHELGVKFRSRIYNKTD
ncbi:MAG: TatD family nuclease-associated radical SAM protein [Desulfuromonas sp.]|nr:TatD family nuclease-associated radical SAM protein [Desulfuromonas sp.]